MTQHPDRWQQMEQEAMARSKQSNREVEAAHTPANS
jgi:hypothetical protein